MDGNWEVEQKFVVSNRAHLQEMLELAGYSLTETQVHCDIYFRHPCRDFRTTDEAFRLRSVGDTSCVTYKGKRLAGPVKTRPELELFVDHAERENWLELIRHLGFEALPAVRKRRQVFCNPHLPQAGIQVVLDEVEQLGEFAELELIVTERKSLEAAQSSIQAFASQLGLTEVQPRSYLSQLLGKIGHEHS